MSKAKFVDWRKVSLSPLILIFGSEEYLSGAAIRRLKDLAKAHQEGVEIHEVDSANYVAGDLENLISPSLFSEPKLIVIAGVEKCSDSLIEDGKAINLADLIDVTVVFQHSGSTTRGKSLLDSLRANEKVIEVACAKITKDADKVSFVQMHFNEANRKFSQSAVRAIVDAFGNNLLELASACDQLLADSSEQIDEDLVDRYFGGRVEADAYRILNAALDGRGGESLLLLRHAIQTGQDLIYMLGAFARKVREMCLVHGNPRASADSLGLSPYGLTQTRKVVSGWTDDGLAKALRAVADADAAAKGAERQPEYRMEQLIVLIANRGRI